MKILRLLIVLLFSAVIANAQTVDSTEIKFQKALDDGKMVFTMPKDYVETPIIKNRQMHYEYAIKSVDKPYEIRYSIAPMTIKGLADMYERDKSKEELTASTLSMTIALNVGGGSWDPTIGFNKFPPEAVKREFGADWGGTWLIPIKNNSFGTEYKYCGMTSLHRSGAADAYIMYLCNSKEDLLKLMTDKDTLTNLFYALKFKQ